MFGGYLGGPDRSRPAIELAEAEKAKSLLAGVIVAGGLGRAIPDTPRNERKIAGAILACWSLVHGLTLLLADGLVGPKKKSGALGDSLVQGMLDGLAAELPPCRRAPGSARKCPINNLLDRRSADGAASGYSNFRAVIPPWVTSATRQAAGNRVDLLLLVQLHHRLLLLDLVVGIAVADRHHLRLHGLHLGHRGVGLVGERPLPNPPPRAGEGRVGAMITVIKRMATPKLPK